MHIFRELDRALRLKGLSYEQKRLLMQLHEFIYTNTSWASKGCLERAIYTYKYGLEAAVERFSSTKASLSTNLTRASAALSKRFNCDIVSLILEDEDSARTVLLVGLDFKGSLDEYLVVNVVDTLLRQVNLGVTKYDGSVLELEVGGSYVLSEMQKELEFLYDYSSVRYKQRLAELDVAKVLFLEQQLRRKGILYAKLCTLLGK